MPWVPDDDDQALEDLSMPSKQTSRLGQWDQFAANEAQFGVQTSFDEDVSFVLFDTSVDANEPKCFPDSSKERAQKFGRDWQN